MVELLPPGQKGLAQTNSTSEDKDGKVEDLSEQELLEKNEDINRNEDKAKRDKNDQFNAVP